MTKEEAMQHGLGYAAGREDASGVQTVSPTEMPGFYTFAEAYAGGWDDYNREVSYHMVSARSAYDRWQATGGQQIMEAPCDTERRMNRLPERIAAVEAANKG